MIRNFLYKLADNPHLFEVFEMIFGADSQKKILYRRAFNNDKKLLDFGCSTGNTTGAFLDFNYTGLDLDPTCIKYATKRWSKHRNVKFVCQDIFDRPFKKSTFDFVLFAGTGHHISDEQFVPIVNELVRALKPGGEIWFYDILRPKKTDSFFMKLLAYLDRGRNIRSMRQYEKIFQNIKNISVTEKEVIKVTAIVPQEDYCFYRLTKN